MRCLARCLKETLLFNISERRQDSDKISFRQSRIPRKHVVLPGKILKRAKSYSRYLVSFTNAQKEVTKQWINVEDITSRTTEEEKRQRDKSLEKFKRLERKARHRQKFYIPLKIIKKS